MLRPRTGMIIMSLLITMFTFTSILSSQALSSQGPKKVAVLPFTMNADRDLDYLKEGIVDMLNSRLAWKDEVVVVEKEIVKKACAQFQTPLNRDKAIAIGKILEIDYIILGSLTLFGESVSLDAKILDVAQSKDLHAVFGHSKGMDEVIPKIDEFAMKSIAMITGRHHPQSYPAYQPQGPAPSTRQPSAFIEAEGQAEFWQSPGIPIRMRGLDIGDVDGDGKNETVVLGPQSIRIYEHNEGKFTLKKELLGPGLVNYLSLDVADINGNGVAEIFVTNRVNKQIESFVVEFQRGTFAKTLTGAKWFFRVIRGLGDPALVGQKLGADNKFYGPVNKLIWEGGHYRAVEPIPLPRRATVCGFNLIDIDGKGESEIVFLDNNDTLQVYPLKGDRLWISEEYYGGTENRLVSRPEGLSSTAPDIEEIIYLQPRILALNRGPRPEVIVIKNISASRRFLEKAKFFSSSEIHGLVWDGLGLSEKWRTKKIHGYTADFQIKDMDNDGVDELVVGIIKTGSSVKSMFGKGESRVLVYELQ